MNRTGVFDPMSVILTADSSADLPQTLRDRYHIRLLPLTVTVGQRTGRDGIDIKAQDIFAAWRLHGIYPKTSAASIGEYLDFFRPLVESGHEMVHISLNSAISSSYQNACLAAEEFPGVYVVDSRLCTISSAMLCAQAGMLLQQHESAEQIAQKLEQIRANIYSNYYLDKLDFIAKGGRVPAIAALGANFLQIHPSVLMNGKTGEIPISKRFRNKTHIAQQTWITDTAARMRDTCDQRLALLGFTPDVPHEQRALLETLAREQLPQVQEWILCEVGCMIISHCGPNCAGLVMMEG